MYISCIHFFKTMKSFRFHLIFFFLRIPFMCFVYRFVMQAKTFWAHLTEGNSFMFCVLLSILDRPVTYHWLFRMWLSQTISTSPPELFKIPFSNAPLHTVDDNKRSTPVGTELFLWPRSGDKESWFSENLRAWRLLQPAWLRCTTAARLQGVKMWRMVYIHTV